MIGHMLKSRRNQEHFDYKLILEIVVGTISRFNIVFCSIS